MFVNVRARESFWPEKQTPGEYLDRRKCWCDRLEKVKDMILLESNFWRLVGFMTRSAVLVKVKR